jgi:hypothetical protein
MPKLILLELNEINFDYVRSYVDLGAKLPGFDWLMSQEYRETRAEKSYELLEPWIQWPSVHTGLTFQEHEIFRLGDITKSDSKQIFEMVEEMGFKVGAISPMNAANRLNSPTYFIPDPWTKTQTSGNIVLRLLANAISQAVNENSGNKITIKSLFSLALAFITLVPHRQKITLFKYAINIKNRSWRKALFLDILLYEIHKNLFQKTNTEFSTLFLNAGAHIQHHYFLNSSVLVKSGIKNPHWYIDQKTDPILEMLTVYDKILLDLSKQVEFVVLIATGLSQTPYQHTHFYYRLKNHEQFLTMVGINFIQILPRMTRDFLVVFTNEGDCFSAADKLSRIQFDNGKPLFGSIENRGKELFVVLDYNLEIGPQTKVFTDNIELSIYDFINFVAIKNGEHQDKGFAFFSPSLTKYAPASGEHVSKLHYTILNYFKSSTTNQNQPC